MKTTKKQFSEFKKACLEWQKRLGLLDWSLYFGMSKLEDAYATVNINVLGRVATVLLTSVLEDKDVADNLDIGLTALHEMLHILLARMQYIATARYVTEEEVLEEEHSIIRVLEKVVR